MNVDAWPMGILDAPHKVTGYKRMNLDCLLEELPKVNEITRLSAVLCIKFHSPLVWPERLGR